MNQQYSKIHFENYNQATFLTIQLQKKYKIFVVFLFFLFYKQNQKEGGGELCQAQPTAKNGNFEDS